MVDLLFFTQIGDDACKHVRISILIPDQLSPTPKPDPFPLCISCPVLNVVLLYTSVGNLLVTLQEMCFIMWVNQTAPAGCSILHHLTGQAKLRHHSRGISENTGFHIAYEYIIICTFYQRVIQTCLIVLELILRCRFRICML